VDAAALPPGLHYAEVHATIPGQEWRGPLFRVPVTLIKPQNLLRARDIDAAAPAAAAAAVVQAPSGQQAAAAGAHAGAGASSSSSGGSGSSSSGGSGDAGRALPPHTLRLGPVALHPGQEVRRWLFARRCPVLCMQQAAARHAPCRRPCLLPEGQRPLHPCAPCRAQVRHFVAVPAGATWAELLVRAGAYDTPRVFLIRCTRAGGGMDV
jgi:tripeptidyl-peptidase-2